MSTSQGSLAVLINSIWYRAFPPKKAMSATAPSPITTTTSNVSQSAQNDVSKIWRLYDRISTGWVTAFGVLITALTVGALKAGKLGGPPFSWQLCTTIIVVGISPAISRHNLWANLKNWQLIFFWMVWTILCAGPVFVSLVIELFTGHQRPGSHWFEGVWRVYAILGLWMIIAVAMEQYVKPFWRVHSEPLLRRFRNRSVSARGQNMAIQQRTARLEAIKNRVVILMRRKKRLQSLIDRKCEEISRLQNDSNSYSDDETYVERRNSLDRERDVWKEELEDVEDRLRLSQMEWTEALNVANYRTFYR